MLEEKEGKPKKKKSKAFIIIFIFIILVVVSDMNAVENKEETLSNMSAIEKMEVAFDGDYSKSEIEERISKAMTLYNVPLTEENYSRSGSSLVALRQEYGVEEMVILDYMIRSYVPDVKMNFAQTAGIAVSFLLVGDK